MEDLCTLHQRLSHSGKPLVQGSEVRLPSGEVIPWVTKVETKAEVGSQFWVTTITLRTRFGDPIRTELLDDA